METASALTVVPPWQVNAAGMVVALNDSLCTFINIFLAVASCEPRRTDTFVRSHARSTVSAALLAECSADGPVAHVARFARAAVSLDSVGADGILITAVLPTATLVVLCTREVIHTNVSRDTVTAI